MKSPEQFNPYDPKYKKVEDLPEEQRESFVDVGGGFVRKEAVQQNVAFDQAAQNMNKARPFLDKITSKNKVAGEEIAHQEALNMERERQNKVASEERERQEIRKKKHAEEFDKYDPWYQNFEDLPSKEQHWYKPAEGGGFVKKDALGSEDAAALATEAKRVVESGEVENYKDALRVLESLKSLDESIERAKKNNEDQIMDGHHLCHFLEGYRSNPELRGTYGFSFLNHPKTLERVKNYIALHVSDTIRLGEAYCGSRVIMPIFSFNMDNIKSIKDSSFAFRPDFLKQDEYVEVITNLNKKEFSYSVDKLFSGDFEALADFFRSENPKDFFLRLIKRGVKLPTDNPMLVAETLEIAKDEIEKEKMEAYVRKNYNPNNESDLSIDKLLENIKETEMAHELVRGVFVDVDGTLIIDGQLNEKLVADLEKVNTPVIIFSGGDPESQTERLRNLGFSEKYLPVHSKKEYQGKILEKLIDDSNTNYQGFEALFQFWPNKDYGAILFDSEKKINLTDETENIIHYLADKLKGFDKFKLWNLGVNSESLAEKLDILEKNEKIDFKKRD